MNIDFSNFPELTTSRLVLRQLTEADQGPLSLLRSDIRVNQFIARPKESSMREAFAFITKINEGIRKNENLYWAICTKFDPRLIGTICLWNFSEGRKTAEVGFELTPSFFLQGIMNEALNCVMNYAFETLGIQMLEAFTHKENVSSIRLLEKNKFVVNPQRIDKSNLNNLIFERFAQIA